MELRVAQHFQYLVDGTFQEAQVFARDGYRGMCGARADYFHRSLCFRLFEFIVIPSATPRLMRGALICRIRIVDDNCTAVFVPACGAPVRQRFPFALSFYDFLYLANELQIIVDVREFALLVFVLPICVPNDRFSNLFDFPRVEGLASGNPSAGRDGGVAVLPSCRGAARRSP